MTQTTAYVAYGATPSMQLTDTSSLSGPWDVAVNQQTGFVYVASLSNNRLCIFNGISGYFIQCLSQWQTSNNEVISLYRPRGVTLTRDGFVITDEHRVVVIESGVVTQVWGWTGQAGTQLGQFNEPRGTAVDRSGRIYVADHNNDRVQVIDPSTGDIQLLGSGADARFPNSIAIHPISNDVMVTIGAPHSVVIFSHNGEPKRTVPLSYWPNNLFVDFQGYMYISGHNNLIQVYDNKWTLIQSFGGTGSCPGCFGVPLGIQVNNGNGDLLVADHSNNCVKVFRKNSNK